MPGVSFSLHNPRPPLCHLPTLLAYASLSSYEAMTRVVVFVVVADGGGDDVVLAWLYRWTRMSTFSTGFLPPPKAMQVQSRSSSGPTEVPGARQWKVGCSEKHSARRKECMQQPRVLVCAAA